MQKIDTWYKAEGYCPSEEYELASYLLFEAGVATLEELDPKAEGRTDFCFYTGDKAERDRIEQEKRAPLRVEQLKPLDPKKREKSDAKSLDELLELTTPGAGKEKKK